MEQAISLNYGFDIPNMGYTMISTLSSITIKNAHTGEIVSEMEVVRRKTYIDQLKQLFLMEFYKDPWAGIEVITQGSTIVPYHPLSIISKIASRGAGVDLVYWAENTQFSYTKSKTIKSTGPEKVVICKYYFSPQSKTLTTTLKAITGYKDCRAIELVHPIASTDKERYVPDIDQLQEYHKKELDLFFMPAIGTVDGYQTLRSKEAYWDPEKPEIIELLERPPEGLTRFELVKLARELDRRFVQLWDKIGHENNLGGKHGPTT